MADYAHILLYVCNTEADAQDRIGSIGAGYVTEIKSVEENIRYDAVTKSDGVADGPSGKWLLIAKKQKQP